MADDVKQQDDSREEGGRLTRLSAFVFLHTEHAIYAALGDTGEAIMQLEKAFDDRSYWIIYLNVDPALDALRRAENEFEDHLEGIGKGVAA